MNKVVQFRNLPRARGFVEITAINEDGTREVLFNKKNTLTTNFSKAITRLIAGDVGEFTGPTNREVVTSTALWASHMTIGSSTTPPSKTDVALYEPIPDTDDPTTDFIMPITSKAYSTPAQTVTFYAVIPQGTNDDFYNQFVLQEVGLHNEIGDLIARQIYPPISKNKVFQLQYAWTISFAI